MIKKPKLVPDWKQSLTWYSQKVNLALVSVAPVWLAIPEDMRQSIPPTWLAIFAATLGVLGFIGRLLAQG